MRIFASDRVAMIMQRLGMEEGEAIEHPWVTRAIENAQRKVEARNFDIRKQLLEYDNVANDQRHVIYHQRDELMAADDISETIKAVREDVVDQMITQYIPSHSLEEQWDVKGLEEALERELGVEVPVQLWLEQDHHLHEEQLRQKIQDVIDANYAEKRERMGAGILHHLEKSVMLQVLDNSWKEHLAAMDHLRQGIHLRGYAQKDPKQEYKREAFEMFTSMLDGVKEEVTSVLSRVQVHSEEDVARMDVQNRPSVEMHYEHADAVSLTSEEPDAEQEVGGKAGLAGSGGSSPAGREVVQQPFVRDAQKVGRNDPCPCGSGKKFKQCHGRLN